MVIHFIATLRLRNKYANKELQIALETMKAGKIYKYKGSQPWWKLMQLH